MNHHWDTYFSGAKFEVCNLRAERRDVRDLDQDLEDIANGIEVIHKSEAEAVARETKRERRAASENKRRMAMEKKIRSVGFDGLTEIDKIRALKKFTRSEIRKIEQAARSNPTAEQTTLFEEKTT